MPLVSCSCTLIVLALDLGAVGGLVLLAHVTLGVGIPLDHVVSRSSHGTAFGRSIALGAACTAVGAQPIIFASVYQPWTLAVGATVVSILVSMLVEFKRPFPEDSPPSASRNRPRGTDRGIDLWPRAIAAMSLGASSVVLALGSSRSVRAQDLDGLGIVRAMPAGYWVAIVIGVAATGCALDAQNRRLWPVAPAIWLVLAHGIPFSTQPLPRFATVWIHLGLSEYLVDHGAGGAEIDARLAWPGMFGIVAAPLDLMSDAMVQTVVRWWPLAILAVMVTLIWELVSATRPDMPMMAPIASIVFLLASWTGQDYFSPQSIGVVFYLAMLLLLQQAHEFSVAGRTSAARGPAIGALLLIVAAVVSHPLTPIFMALSLIVLVLYKRRIAAGALVLLSATFLLWFVVSAQPWWSGVLRDMVRQLAEPLDNLQSRPVATAGGSPSRDRSIVVAVRLAYMGALVLVLAAAGFASWRDQRQRQLSTSLRKTRKAASAMLSMGVGGFGQGEDAREMRSRSMPLVALSGAAFGAVLLQSYGGEIAVRAFLFSIPWVSILAAELLLFTRPARFAIIGALAPAAVLVPLLIGRFGNESFEVVRHEDRKTVEIGYEIARGTPQDFAFVGTDLGNPWGDELFGEIPFLMVPLVFDPSVWLASARQATADSGRERGLIVLSGSEQRFRMQAAGKPAEWLDNFAQELVGHGATVHSERPQNYVLEIEAK